ncbi:MAG TPA: endonuclease/exonuclease/phosphatase family protein, partial [Acidimicrobiales bacterium]|nr:endonuclease/exonuclease/phosphatase family protein [Acidimicrobiales bacterium]
RAREDLGYLRRRGGASRRRTRLSTRRLSRATTAPIALALAALAVLALTPSAEAEQPREVTVISRNLYLGANLDPAIGAGTVEQLVAATAHIFSVAQQTNFPERAKALAAEIADADPALVGLQEAAVWYTGPFGDPAPATTVEYDFIATLLRELAAAGARYEVVGVQPEADIEAPAGAPYFRDVRLLQQDAILVRTGPGHTVGLGPAWSDNFDAELSITTGTGQQYVVHRGWVAVDVTVKKQRFRFVNTHLEAFHPLVRLQQAQELLAPDGPVGSARTPVVLVGDLNSGPELPVPENRLAFQALLAAGLVDTWAVAHPADPGFTAGFNELLTDPSAEGALEHRVDHVLVTPDIDVVGSRLYGTDPDNRTASGMWPSDHAGVAATLALPPKR